MRSHQGEEALFRETNNLKEIDSQQNCQDRGKSNTSNS